MKYIVYYCVTKIKCMEQPTLGVSHEEGILVRVPQSEEHGAPPRLSIYNDDVHRECPLADLQTHVVINAKESWLLKRSHDGLEIPLTCPYHRHAIPQTQQVITPVRLNVIAGTHHTSPATAMLLHDIGKAKLRKNLLLTF